MAVGRTREVYKRRLGGARAAQMRKTGWLEKEGMSGVRWNRRFVCVQRGSLRYWSEDPGSAANSKRCKGSMQICEDTVVSPTKQAMLGGFREIQGQGVEIS